MANLHTFHASVRANGVFDIGSVTEVNLVMTEEDADACMAVSSIGKGGGAVGTATFKLCLTGSQQGQVLLEAQGGAVSFSSDPSGKQYALSLDGHAAVLPSWYPHVRYITSFAPPFAAANSDTAGRR